MTSYSHNSRVCGVNGLYVGAAGSETLVFDGSGTLSLGGSGATSATSGYYLKGGISGTPLVVDTANTKFVSFYFDNGATSGDARGIYNRLYITGAGGGGESLRSFTTVSDVAAATVHGAHISLSFGTSGTCTGQAIAGRFTLHIPSTAWTGNQVWSALQAEIWSDATTSDPGGNGYLSAIRVQNGGNATGMADVDTDCALLDLGGWTSGSGKLYYGSTLRIRVSNTDKYLVMSSAEDSLSLAAPLTIGVDGTGHDVIFYGDTASYKVWFDQDGDTNGAWYFGADTKGIQVNLYGDTTGCGVFWDPSTDTNGTLSVGASGGSKGVDFTCYGTTNGAYMTWDQSNNYLELVGLPATDSGKLINIDSELQCTTAGCRQGAIFIGVTRSASYPIASWDGNPDCGLKMQVYNRATNASGGATRAIDILARNRDTAGATTWVNGGTITAENSTGSGGVTDLIGLEVHAKNNGVATGDVKCLRVYDESQSSTGTNYAIEISCTNDSAFTREYCVYINSGAASGWTNGITFDGNITNTLDFADSDGTNGAKIGTYSTADANPSGHIKVDVGGSTRYIYLYTSAVTFS